MSERTTPTFSPCLQRHMRPPPTPWREPPTRPHAAVSHASSSALAEVESRVSGSHTSPRPRRPLRRILHHTPPQEHRERVRTQPTNSPLRRRAEPPLCPQIKNTGQLLQRAAARAEAVGKGKAKALGASLCPVPDTLLSPLMEPQTTSGIRATQLGVSPRPLKADQL